MKVDPRVDYSLALLAGGGNPWVALDKEWMSLMADVFTKEKRSEVMKAIRSKNTRPEVRLRSALHRLGHRFQLHRGGLPGRPDIVFPGKQAAIQVRGCFWHGHDCIDGHIPKTRKDYWVPKLEATKTRDARNDRRLRRIGWRLAVVWACRMESEAGLYREVRRLERFLKA